MFKEQMISAYLLILIINGQKVFRKDILDCLIFILPCFYQISLIFLIESLYYP